jgi:hypothetical protein
MPVGHGIPNLSWNFRAAARYMNRDDFPTFVAAHFLRA